MLSCNLRKTLRSQASNDSFTMFMSSLSSPYFGTEGAIRVSGPIIALVRCEQFPTLSSTSAQDKQYHLESFRRPGTLFDKSTKVDALIYFSN